jgi:hypothetical protein
MVSINALPSNERLYDQLRTVQRIAQIGFWEIYDEDRLKDKYITWSDEVSTILGIEQDYRLRFYTLQIGNGCCMRLTGRCEMKNRSISNAG